MQRLFNKYLHASSRTEGRSGGFTLLELIVVLTVLTLLTAAIVPVFAGSSAGINGDRWVRDLVATLNYAHERSMMQSVEYRVYLDADAGSFWLARLSGYDGGNPVFAPLAYPEGRAMTLPEGYEIDRLRARRDAVEKAHFIAFYPTGASDIAEFRVVRRGSRSGFAISTSGILGEVEVVER